jgi:SAM-dependent methyltransferase
MTPEAYRAHVPLLHVWTKWKGKALRSLRTRGLAGTLIFAAALAKRILCQRWTLYRDARFDQRFAVDTAGILYLPELQSDPRFRYSNGYAPTPRSRFRRMMRRLDVDYSKFLFIDFGCGKGRVLVLAAELPFQQIIGIELSSQLIRVAEDNLRSYLGPRRCHTIQLACTDAGEFPIPGEPAIYYFYDPFQAEMMRKVLENIRRSLAATPRETYVLYFTPKHQHLLDECGFLTPIKQAPWYSIYKSSAS